MKASACLILLILLFVTSGTSQSVSNASSITANSTIPTSDTAASPSNASPTTANSTIPTSDTAASPSNASPTTANSTIPTSDTAASPSKASSTTADSTIPTPDTAASPSNVSSTSANSTSPALNTATVTTTTTPIPTTVSVTTTSIITSSPVPTTTVTSTKIESTANAITLTTTTTPTISSSSGGSTTTVASLTQSKGDSLGTVSSVTFSNFTSSENSTPKPSTTGPSSPCQGDPCGSGSSCVSLNSLYFCLCSEGYYYKSSTCNRGKTFPGTITVKVSETSGLEDEHSVAYQDLYSKVVIFFGSVFGSTDYGQTIILKVSTSPSARSEMRATDRDVDVAVVNILVQTTTEDEKSVSDKIEEAINKDSGDITSYTMQERCDYYGCEKTDAQDDCSNELLCTCKQGLERPNPQISFCLASSPQCPDTCNEEYNRQCLVKNDGSTDCVCLSGYKEDNHGICQKCAFGHRGVGCEDKFQLILTVVGVIAAILLVTVISLIFLVRSKNKRKNIEEENLIDNDYQNLRLQQITGFSNPGADRSIFPKVRTNISRDGQSQNPYANQRDMQNPYANQREW